MTVQQLFVDHKVIPHDQLTRGNPLEKKFVLMALLCNDSVTRDNKEIGDPTEIALVNLGEEYDLDELKVREDYPRVGEIPFDSDRKLMSTVNRVEDKFVMITKGAVDVLLSRMVKVQTTEGIIDFTDEHKQELEKINRNFSKEGLRVLAFAFKDVDEGQVIDVEDEKDLIFVGLTAMMDPPRPRIKRGSGKLY